MAPSSYILLHCPREGLIQPGSFCSELFFKNQREQFSCYKHGFQAFGDAFPFFFSSCTTKESFVPSSQTPFLTPILQLWPLPLLAANQLWNDKKMTKPQSWQVFLWLLSEWDLKVFCNGSVPLVDESKWKQIYSTQYMHMISFLGIANEHSPELGKQLYPICDRKEF